MKKYSFLFALFLVFFLTACGRSVPTDETGSSAENNAPQAVGGYEPEVVIPSEPLLPLPAMNEWVTYTSDSCGFEVQLPASYQPVGATGDCENAGDPNRNPTIFEFVNLSECPFPYYNTPGCQLHTFAVTNSDVLSAGAEVPEATDNLGGVPAQRTTVTGSIAPNVVSIDLQAQKEDLWYRYSYAFHLNDQSASEEIFGLILSSFRFLR